MKKTVLATLIVACITIPAYVKVIGQPSAQPKCPATEADSPSVRGLRLGMTVEQVVALFPAAIKRKQVKDAVEKAKAAKTSETVRISFNPATDSGNQQFAAVDAVSVSTYKGRVVDFSVQYVGPAWNSIDEWIGKLSEAFNLPSARDWMVGPDETPNKVLKCGAIEIEGAVQGGSGTIRIRNTEYLKEMEDRMNAQEEKKRREFKP
jgi:hypothetical protein